MKIPEIYTEYAYVTDDGTVFLPIYDKDRNMVMTGHEYYQSLNKQIDICTPTLEGQLADMQDLVIELSNKLF